MPTGTLHKAIIDFYTSDTGAEAVALRSALGTGKMSADFISPSPAMPYCCLTTLGTDIISQGVGYRLENVTISFDTFANSRDTAESIGEAVENTYCKNKLTVADRTHLQTYFENRTTTGDDKQVYHSTVELRFLMQKST